MAGAAAIFTIAKVVGTVVSVVSAFTAASNESKAAAQNAEMIRQTAAANARIAEANAKAREATAADADRAAGQERASAQREAIERQRKGRLLASEARAKGGASGAVIDPTTEADILSVGKLNALTALYAGEERAVGLEREAEMARYSAELARFEGATGQYTGGLQAQREITEGHIRASAQRRSGVSTLISGGTSLYDSLSKSQGPSGRY